ncbi:MAG: PTS sugar transporter subunit IIA [Alphaproteobacteria bacterium]
MRELLSPKAVVADLAAATKKDILIEIARHASVLAGKDAHNIFNVLWERERLGTTGVGYGIAIPHGRLEGLSSVQGFFIRLSQPVAFESIDDRPVDLIFLLLAPADAGADHLHALATVSRLLRDQKLCEQIRRAKDEATIYRLLTETPTAQAA